MFREDPTTTPQSDSRQSQFTAVPQRSSQACIKNGGNWNVRPAAPRIGRQDSKEETGARNWSFSTPKRTEIVSSEINLSSQQQDNHKSINLQPKQGMAVASEPAGAAQKKIPPEPSRKPLPKRPEVPLKTSEYFPRENNLDKKQMVKILITGKSGTSKSVIINGLVGEQLIPERKGVVSKPRSNKLEYYTCMLGAYQVCIWSSPHLQDEDKRINIDTYCEELKRSCSDVDLIIYCLNMTETRFLPGNPDIKSMVRLTDIFSESCWKKTIFAMTFANLAATSTFSVEEDDSEEMKIQAFKNGIEAWRKIIQNVLINYAKVREEIDIKVVPAGHYSRPSLPDRESWLADLFLECVATMPEEARDAMIKGNECRLKRCQSFNPSSISGKKIHQQQITIFDTLMKKISGPIADLVKAFT